MPAKKKIKVLVIRFSSIGDIVLCSPVLRCLKKIEDTEIETHLLTKKAFLSFTSNYPYIDKVFALENSLGKVIRELKKENYDYILDLHSNLRSQRVKLSLMRPSSTFEKLNVRKWLYTRFKVNYLPDVHIVDRLMAAALPLGVKNDGQGLDFFVPEKDQVDISSTKISLNEGYVAFVIGGTYVTKRLPKEKIIAVCNLIKGPVVLLGGKEDAITGELIESAAPGKIFNACGKYNLNQSASWVQQASVVISHDTGLMHIAAAFRKPMASVWGNTVPEFGMHPYYPEGFSTDKSAIFEIDGLSCRPCSKLGFNQCPEKHFNCMIKIDSHKLAQWVNQWL